MIFSFAFSQHAKKIIARPRIKVQAAAARSRKNAAATKITDFRFVSFRYNVYFFRSCRSNRQFGAKIKIKTLSCCFSFSGNLTFKLGQLKMALLVTDVSLLYFSPSKLSFFLVYNILSFAI